MKKILKYTAFAAMVGLFSSCSDSFFEAESGDIITSDQMDEVDPVAGLNGMLLPICINLIQWDMVMKLNITIMVIIIFCYVRICGGRT